MPFLAFVAELDDQVPYFIRIGYFIKDKTVHFAGGLDIQIAIVEYGRDSAFYFTGRILDTEKHLFGNDPGKEAALVYVHYPLGRDYPDVQVIIYKIEEEHKPDEQIIGASAQNHNRISDLSF